MNAILQNVMPGGALNFDWKRSLKAVGLLLLMALCLLLTCPSYAVDMITMAEANGTALETAAVVLNAMGPGIKILVGFIAFVVALISLAALRNFGPVLFFIGVAIFGATGLAVAGTIMGADVAHIAAM